MQGKLYLVATPIGNLEDITLRAIRTLKEVDLIACEDTRNTLKLLNHLEISKPLISYHRHNEEMRKEELIEKIKQGNNIAIVSDAGTPIISDPGQEVVKVAIENEIEIVPIPGACAFVNALIASGIEGKEFSFLGFLPLDKKLRREKLEEIKDSKKTVILYEAPHKLKKTLEDLKDEIKNRKVVLAHELTKIYESFIRGSVDQVLEKVQNPKGEFVIVIEGSLEEEKNDIVELLNTMSLDQHYEYYQKQGYDKKDIIKKIAKDKKVSKNEIYQYFVKG